MRRDEVLKILREQEPELRKAGVLGLRLFGSMARNEPAPSDVDLLARFDRRVSLFGLVGIQNRLSDLLGMDVDLIQEGTLKPRIQLRVEREAVVAF